MADINFPIPEYIGQTYTFGNKTWKWNGVGWVILNAEVEAVYATNAEVENGKTEIATALTTMGQSTSPTESLSAMANKIYHSGLNVSVNSTQNQALWQYPSNWHDLFVAMAAVYDPTKPYMYALLIDKYTPASVLAMFTDGQVQVLGNVSSSYITRTVVFKSSNQVGFNANYNSTFANYIFGVAVYNADIQNVSFYGSYPQFLYYNDNYSLSTITYSANQFNGTWLYSLIVPSSTNLVFFSGINSFNSSKLMYFKFSSGITSLSINTGMWANCSSLTQIIFPNTLTSLSIPGSSPFTYGQIYMLTFPTSLTYLSMTGSFMFYTSSIKRVFFPNCKDYFVMNSTNPFQGSSVTFIDLEIGWKWNFSVGSGYTILSHDSQVSMFASLVDKRKDSINPSTCSTTNGSKIVTFTNGNCTNVFVSNAYVQQQIKIGGTTYTIASVDNDNQVTLTANASATNTNVAYDMLKTLTLGATNLARVSAAEIQVATDKGWTIA